MVFTFGLELDFGVEVVNLSGLALKSYYDPSKDENEFETFMES